MSSRFVDPQIKYTTINLGTMPGAKLYFTITGTSTPKIYGIAVTSSTYTTVGNPSNALIYNNTVSRINSTGTSSVWNLTGILASAGYGDRYYNNSVHLTGQLSNTASGLAAAFATAGFQCAAGWRHLCVRDHPAHPGGPRRHRPDRQGDAGCHGRCRYRAQLRAV